MPPYEIQHLLTFSERLDSLGLEENANVSYPSHVEQQCNRFAWFFVFFPENSLAKFPACLARFKWSNVLEKLWSHSADRIAF